MKIATNRHGFSKCGEFGAMWRISPRVITLGQGSTGQDKGAGNLRVGQEGRAFVVQEIGTDHLGLVYLYYQGNEVDQGAEIPPVAIFSTLLRIRHIC